MKIVINNLNSNCVEKISLNNLEDIYEILKKFISIKDRLEAKIFVVNETISCYQLSKLKNHFEKINFCSFCIYSNE